MLQRFEINRIKSTLNVEPFKLDEVVQGFLELMKRTKQVDVIKYLIIEVLRNADELGLAPLTAPEIMAVLLERELTDEEINYVSSYTELPAGNA